MSRTTAKLRVIGRRLAPGQNDGDEPAASDEADEQEEPAEDLQPADDGSEGDEAGEGDESTQEAPEGDDADEDEGGEPGDDEGDSWQARIERKIDALTVAITDAGRPPGQRGRRESPRKKKHAPAKLTPRERLELRRKARRRKPRLGF